MPPAPRKPPAGYAKGIHKHTASMLARAARRAAADRERNRRRIRNSIPPYIHSPLPAVLTNEQIALVVALVARIIR